MQRIVVKALSHRTAEIRAQRVITPARKLIFLELRRVIVLHLQGNEWLWSYYVGERVS